jgi:hypothetical protein
VANDSILEILFLMVILKIPIVYLCLVVWWAIKSEPRPEEGAAVTAAVGPEAPRPRPRRRGPLLRPFRRPRPWYGGPARTYARSGRAPAAARAKLPKR